MVSRSVSRAQSTTSSDSPDNAETRAVVTDDEGDEAEVTEEQIEVALSSETPVERWFGMEILDHSKGAVDLTRAENGLPLLDTHDAYTSVLKQFGVIDDVRIDSDKVIRGTLRFSQRADAQSAKQDILDGIITSISIGYIVDAMDMESSAKNGPSTYRVTKWRLLEASLVSVPADTTVGVGRSVDHDTHSVAVRSMVSTAPVAGENAVADNATATRENGGAATITVSEDRAAAFTRTEQLADLAAVTGRGADLATWLSSSRTVADIRTELMAQANANLQAITAPVVALTEKEERQYSLVRAINAASNNTRKGAEFEFEVSDQVEKNLPSGVRRNGGQFFMPTSIGASKRTAITVGGTGTGAEAVFTEPGNFIELLRNRMMVRALGATVLGGLRGPVAFPKQSGAGTFAWLAESGTVSESNIATTQVALNPKTGRGRESYSKQLLAEASVDVENMVRNDLALISALGIDLGAINGSGSSNQPLGILGTSGIGSVAGGTNGLQPTLGNIVDLESAVASANGDISKMAYLTTAGIRGRLKQTPQFASSNGLPIWMGGKDGGEMNGYLAAVSNQVPSTLTKGSSSICHAIIFGCWDQLIIGEWGALEIQVDPYSRADNGEIVVRTFQMVGIAVRQAAAFAAMKDALA